MNLVQDLEDTFQDDESVDYVPPELAEFVAQAKETLISSQRSLQDDLHANDNGTENRHVDPVDDIIPPLEDEQDDGRLADLLAQVKALESTPFEDDELDDDAAITKQFMAKFGLTASDVGGSDPPDGPNDAANIYTMLSSKGPSRGMEEKKTNDPCHNHSMVVSDLKDNGAVRSRRTRSMTSLQSTPTTPGGDDQPSNYRGRLSDPQTPSFSFDPMDDDSKEEKPAASKGGFLKSVFGRFPKNAPTEHSKKDSMPRAYSTGAINSSITTDDITEPSIDDDFNPAAFVSPNTARVMALGLDDTKPTPAVPKSEQDTEPMNKDPKEVVVEAKPASKGGFFKSVFSRRSKDAPTDQPKKEAVLSPVTPLMALNKSVETDGITEPSVDDVNPAAFVTPGTAKAMALGNELTLPTPASDAVNTTFGAPPELEEELDPMDYASTAKAIDFGKDKNVETQENDDDDDDDYSLHLGNELNYFTNNATEGPRMFTPASKDESTSRHEPEDMDFEDAPPESEEPEDVPPEDMEIEDPKPEEQVVSKLEDPEPEHVKPDEVKQTAAMPAAKSRSSNIIQVVQCHSVAEPLDTEEAPKREAEAPVSQQPKPVTKAKALTAKQPSKAKAKPVTQPRIEKLESRKLKNKATATTKAPARRIQRQSTSRRDQGSQSFIDRLSQPKNKAVPKTATSTFTKTSTRALPVSRTLFSRKNQRKIAPLPVKNTQPAEDASTRAGALPPATSAVSEPKAQNGTTKEKMNGKSGSHEVAENKKQGESQATRVRATKPTARAGRTSLTSATTRSRVTPKPAVSQTSSQRDTFARLAARSTASAASRVSTTRESNFAKTSSLARTGTSTQRKSPTTSATDAATTASAKKSAAAAAEARAAARKRVLMRQKEQEKKREEQLAKAKAAAAKKKVSKPLMASRLGIRSAENKTTARPRLTVPQGPRLSTSARHGGKPGRHDMGKENTPNQRPEPEPSSGSGSRYTMAEQMNRFNRLGLRAGTPVESVSPKEKRQLTTPVPFHFHGPTPTRGIKSDQKPQVILAEELERYMRKGIRESTPPLPGLGSREKRQLTTPVPFRFHGPTPTRVVKSDQKPEVILGEELERYMRKGLRSSTPSPIVRRELTTTIPKPPKFTPVQKREKAKSTAEKEEELMEYYRSHPFKAAPAPTRASTPKGPVGVPKVDRKPLTQPKPFRLRTESRKTPTSTPKGLAEPTREELDQKECEKQFRARPMPHLAYQPPKKAAVPDRKLTVPKPFTLSANRGPSNEETRMMYSDEIELQKQFRARPLSKAVLSPPAPLSKAPSELSTKVSSPRLRTSERTGNRPALVEASQSKADQQIAMREKAKLQRQRLKHQREMESSAQLRSPVNKEDIKPFTLRSQARHEVYQQRFQESVENDFYEEQMKREFRASPLVSSPPPSLEKVRSDKPLTKPEPFNFLVDDRHKQYQEALAAKVREEEARARRLTERKARKIPAGLFHPKPITPGRTAKSPSPRVVATAMTESMAALGGHDVEFSFEGVDDIL